MNPQSLTSRSPIYRRLRDLGAQFSEINDCAAAESFGEPQDEALSMQTLALCDLSALARLGIKGPGTPTWVCEQHVQVPNASNQASRQPDGALVARLAPNEIMVLSDLNQQSALTRTLTASWNAADDPPATPRGFLVPRQDTHVWFMMLGREASSTLAKLCAVDLRARAFEPLNVAQTSIARVNAIVIRDDLGGIPAFHLLADYACADYWWECLLDAGTEHKISAVGLASLRSQDV